MHFYNGNMMEDVLQYNSFEFCQQRRLCNKFLMEVKDFRTQLIFPSVSSAYLNILDAQGTSHLFRQFEDCNRTHRKRRANQMKT